MARTVRKFEAINSRFVSEPMADGETDTRTVSMIFSTEANDTFNTTFRAAGWRLDRFRKNPVLLYGHDDRGLPIGRCKNVRVEGRKLVGDVEFADAETYPFADTVYRMVKGGFLNAGSIRFEPIKWQMRDDGGIDFLEQELLEFSIVAVPANAECLVTARSVGGIDTAPLIEAATNSPAKGGPGLFATRARQIRLKLITLARGE